MNNTSLITRPHRNGLLYVIPKKGTHYKCRSCKQKCRAIHRPHLNETLQLLSNCHTAQVELVIE